MKRLANDSESGENPIMPNKPSHHTVESRADAAFNGRRTATFAEKDKTWW